MTYDVDYFINKFSKIPSSKWTTHARQDSEGRRCAHGWCYPKNVNPEKVFESAEEKAFSSLAEKLGESGMGFINNGEDTRYKQRTPKSRVLAALYDIKNQIQ